jgi:hypothetical protein
MKALTFLDSNKKIIIGLVVVIILLYALKKLYTNLKRSKEGLATDINTHNLNESVNYANEALRVKQAYLDPWFGSGSDMESCAKIMLTFNNDELKQISNLFRSQYNKTMLSVIKSRFCFGCEYNDILIEKLERLNLA